MFARIEKSLRRHLLGGVALAGILTAVTAVPVQAQGTAPAKLGDSVAKALPSDTIALFRIDDIAKLRESFKGSQTGQLWQDPAMKPMRDKLIELLAESGEKAKEAIGMTLRELLELPQGEMAIAVLGRPGDAAIPVAVLAVADAGANADKMADVMARVTKLAEEDAAVATEEANGLTLHIIRSKEAGDAAPPLVWAQKGSVFHLSSDLDALKSLAMNSSGREDSLASNPNFDAVGRKLGAAPATFFVDVARAVDVGLKAAEANGVDGDQLKAQMNLLGLAGLKAIGGTFTFDEGDFDSVARMYVMAPAPRSGVLKLFQMPPAGLRPEPWVPANVASYASYSLDFDAFYVAVGELVDQFAPGVMEQAEKALAEQEGGLNLKADLLGPLGKRVTAISDYKKPVTETSQRVVIGIELDDTKTAQNTLNKILDLAGASPKKRTFQGETIYDFDLPAEAAQGGLSGPISMTIAKDHIYISTEPTLLEQVLRGGGTSLIDTPEFQAVSKAIPERVSLIGFSRPDEAVQMVYGMMGGEQFKTALEQMRAQAPADALDFSQLFDPKLMPEYDEVKKYLAPSGSYGVPDEDGVVLTQFTLKKRP